MKEKRNIEIPEHLYSTLEKNAKILAFENVEEYVVFILEEVVKDENETKEKISKKEEKEITEGLRKLGYK